MQDISWKFFSQTGNIETYLLIKELETGKDTRNEEQGIEAESTSNGLEEV